MIGNDLEFKKIYEEFRPKIFRFLRRMVGEYSAEDLTQEVFIKVNNSLKSFRGDSKLSTWIYKIATNAALDKLRSSSFNRILSKESSQDQLLQIELKIENGETSTNDNSLSPDKALIQKEMNACIRNFIEQLPPDYRTVIVLSELEDLKNIQIADILGITLDTVKIRLHRARVKLKEKLEAHCNFYRNEGNELACDLKSALKDLRDE